MAPCPSCVLCLHPTSPYRKAVRQWECSSALGSRPEGTWPLSGETSRNLGRRPLSWATFPRVLLLQHRRRQTIRALFPPGPEPTSRSGHPPAAGTLSSPSSCYDIALLLPCFSPGAFSSSPLPHQAATRRRSPGQSHQVEEVGSPWQPRCRPHQWSPVTWSNPYKGPNVSLPQPLTSMCLQRGGQATRSPQKVGTVGCISDKDTGHSSAGAVCHDSVTPCYLIQTAHTRLISPMGWKPIIKVLREKSV